MLCGGDCQKETDREKENKFQIVFYHLSQEKEEEKNVVYIYKLHNDALKSCNILHTLIGRIESTACNRKEKNRGFGESTHVQGKNR